MIPDILFQYHSTTANTDTSEAELAFQADEGGKSMLTALWAASSAGGTVNQYRMHHCGPQEEPAPANMILHGQSRTSIRGIQEVYHTVKIVLNPGDRLYCQFHSGNGITLTGYGLRPQVYDMENRGNMQNAMPIMDQFLKPTAQSMDASGNIYG
mgnify:CR=1 FL=1|tara:strand:+ start:2137 stop:2598 length:462 start_codon:yes stop_codon:yes gene_type:complete